MRGADLSDRFYESFYFGDTPEMGNELAELVLAGRKRGTAGLRWGLDADGKRVVRVGDLSVMTDGVGVPRAVIETTDVAIVPYQEVTAEFAATEGEGDGSLQHWREVHWAYFGRECTRIGRIPAHTMPVVCERFAVVYR